MAKPILRGTTWRSKRRVPKWYAIIEPRKVIWERPKTDSLSVAMQNSQGVWLGDIEGSEARLDGRDGDAAVKFAASANMNLCCGRR